MAYRGTYRPGPTYIDALPEDSPINQLWMNETDLMISDPFTNLEDAKRIQDIYAQAGFGFDLVMVLQNEEQPPDDPRLRFLGYDLSHVSGYSLLSWDLNFSEPAPEFFHQRDKPVYRPLLLLIQIYFRPRLNSYRLFETREDAEFFQETASAMTNGFGAVWESTEYGPFKLVRIYMVRSREEILNEVCQVT